MLSALVVLALVSAAPEKEATADVFPAPPAIVADGLPPVPRALAEDVGRYTEFRSALFLDWHPTRREMLVLTRFADTSQVHRVASPGGARRQLTFFRDAVRDPEQPWESASFVPSDPNRILLTKDIGGNEQTQLYRLDLDTATPTLLTDGKSRYTLPVWAAGRDLLAFVSTERNGKDVDLYVAQASKPGERRRVLELSGGGWRAQDFSPDGERLLLLEYISINESRLWLVDLKKGEKRQVSAPGEQQVSYGEARFTADGKGAFVTSDRASEFRQLVHLDLATFAERPITTDLRWGVEDVAISKDRKQLAFEVNEDGFSRIYVMDARARKPRALAGIPRGLVYGMSFHSNGRDLGFSVTAARLPLDAFSVDVVTGKLSRWTASETGWVNAEIFSEPEQVRWKGQDGTALSGLLYRPPARFTGKRPLLVNIHGGPEGQARPGFLAANNYFIEELGMALLLPNVRGSTGYGKTFAAMDNGFKREDTYRDIEALFDHVRQDPRIDADRIVVRGGSYGGHMVLAIATRYPERIQAAISIVGISSFVTFLETTAEYRRDLRRVEYGDERDPQMRAFMERIAPMTNAEKIRKPLLVVQGRNDPRVPIGEADQMVKTVREKGVPVWYLVANDEGHGFKKKQNADYELYVTALFLRELQR